MRAAFLIVIAILFAGTAQALAQDEIFVSVFDEGTKFTANSSGTYRFTIVGGAYENCPPKSQPGNPECWGWLSQVLFYKNRPIEWIGGIRAPLHPNPANWDFSIGDTIHKSSYEEAEKIAMGMFVDIPLQKNEYVMTVIFDSKGDFLDNSGKIHFSVSKIASTAIAPSNGNDGTKYTEIFKDDFEDGNTVGWQFNAGGGEPKEWASMWKIESEGSNRILSGEKHTHANIKGLEVTDFSLETKFKFIREDEGFHLNVRDSEKGRYAILFDINSFSLSLSKGGRSSLLGYEEVTLYKTYAQFNPNTWYKAKILVSGNNIKVYVDGVLKINYIDDKPLPSGRINFETFTNAHIHFDDISIQVPSKEVSSPSGSSGDSQLWNSKGIAFSEAGKYQDALNAFDKAIELDPNNANAWENKGYALQDLGRYKEAVEALDRALEFNPDNLNALARKGWSLDALGKRTETIAVAQEVINKSDRLIAVNLNDNNAWHYKGTELNFLGKYDEAITALDKALSIDPNNPHTWYVKGQALSALGRYQEALDALDKATRINPSFAHFWRSKGDALKALGKYQEANEAYDKAIEVTTGLPSGVASGTDNLFLARIIAILVFFILIISIVFSQKENNRINASSYVIAGLSAYAILDLVGGWLHKDLFLLIGFGAAVFGILSRSKRMVASLIASGSVSFFVGFAMFMLIVGGNPESAGPITLPALLIWGGIHGIGVGGITKNFRIITVIAGAAAFGILIGAVSTDTIVYFGLHSGSPFGYGIFGGVLGVAIGVGMYYASVYKPEIQPKPEFIQKLSSEEQILAPDIKRGYAVLSSNDIKFGIRVSNTTGYTITDVDTILDYTEELFKLKKSKIQRIGNIPPDTTRTATYILKPLGCIHNENINAIVSYTDATGKKHALHMRPKEVHCVCPFLKEKPMTEGEYSRLASSSEFVQEGVSFKGISVDELAKFMGETCRHMLYKVKEYDLDGRKVIYLSGESLGEKAYYLLTVVIQEYKGLTQVVLRAYSDKKYGLNGFMNEVADSIRHLIGSVQSAKEIGIIENTQVINIIDSVVQRTSFEMGAGGKAQLNIRDSVVQRSNIGKE